VGRGRPRRHQPQPQPQPEEPLMRIDHNHDLGLDPTQYTTTRIETNGATHFYIVVPLISMQPRVIFTQPPHHEEVVEPLFEAVLTVETDQSRVPDLRQIRVPSRVPSMGDTESPRVQIRSDSDAAYSNVSIVDDQ
jgi:hypothetical protein